MHCNQCYRATGSEVLIIKLDGLCTCMFNANPCICIPRTYSPPLYCHTALQVHLRVYLATFSHMHSPDHKGQDWDDVGCGSVNATPNTTVSIITIIPYVV